MLISVELCFFLPQTPDPSHTHTGYFRPLLVTFTSFLGFVHVFVHTNRRTDGPVTGRTTNNRNAAYYDGRVINWTRFVLQ